MSIDTSSTMRGAIPGAQNLHFATVSRDRHTESCKRVRFIHQNTNARRTTAPYIPKCHNVRFATAACAKMYESIDHQPTCFAQTKKCGFIAVLGDRHHVFDERVARRTPEISVSLQFWAIDNTFLAIRLRKSKRNLRFATVLGDRHHVFEERVAQRHLKCVFRYSLGRSTPRF